MNLVELVPHDPDECESLARTISEFPQVTGINIPDIVRYPTRSHTMAIRLASHGINAIPHIRCKDRSLSENIEIVSQCEAAGIKSVLLISGDTHPDRIRYDLSVPDVIAALRIACPHVQVMACVDPYRQSFQAEFTYAHKKISAGAAGLFTQPFFDPRLAKIYADYYSNIPLFIGISPVTTEKSRHYWETQNSVVFPPGFDITIDWASQLARRILAIAIANGQNTYIMPIKLPIIPFLKAVFDPQHRLD